MSESQTLQFESARVLQSLYGNDLARLGAESKAVITGDHTQIDLPANKRSGLVEAMGALQTIEGIDFCHFGERDVIRHELVQSIVRAYRRHRGAAEPETKR